MKSITQKCQPTTIMCILCRMRIELNAVVHKCLTRSVPTAVITIKNVE